MRKTRTVERRHSGVEPTPEIAAIEMRVEGLTLSGRFAKVSARSDRGTLEIILPQADAPRIGADLVIRVLRLSALTKPPE